MRFVMNLRGMTVWAVVLAVLGFAAVGCSIPLRTDPPTVLDGSDSEAHRELVSLPKPSSAILAAVYRFPDETGQRKLVPNSNATSFATAVTQGGASILAQALLESGWFVVLERPGLTALSQERQLIRSTRMEFGNKDAAGNPLPPLNPLLYAGVLFEGGIIGYDSNTVTGGFGIRWLGLGPFTQWRRDQVTIYLRAVSVKNGRVLQSVSTTKTILSREVSAGVFKYLTPNRLLESESGFTVNEPVQLAVRQAIEKAVTSIIVQGILDGNWGVANKEELNNPLIQEYRKLRGQVNGSVGAGQ